MSRHLQRRFRIKGSITVYLVMLSGILLTLVCAGFYSLRLQGARTVIRCAAKAGIHSAMAEYDGNLYDRFDLLFLDGSGGSENLNLSSCLWNIRKAAEICCGLRENDAGQRASSLWGIRSMEPAITGYTLATDQEGAAFVRQAAAWGKSHAAMEILDQLGTALTGHGIDLSGTTLQESELTEGNSASDQAMEEYQKVLEGGGEEESDTGAATSSGESTASKGVSDESEDKTTASAGKSAVTTKGEVSSSDSGKSVENPIATIHQLKKKGLLALVLPTDKELSAGTLEEEELLSQRELQEGMGVVPEKESSSLSDRLFYLAYAQEHFTSFTSDHAQGNLHYQMEYLIGGGLSDEENLETALKKLLLLREAANLLYLEKDAAKKSQAEALALEISTALAVPAAEEALCQILLACWAYGESLMDLRTLTAGGKVPLTPDESSWQLELENLIQVAGEEADSAGSSTGLTYDQYLSMLVFMTGEDVCVERSQNIVENVMRSLDNYENFRLDNCVNSLSLSLRVTLQGSAPVTVTEYQKYS